MPLQRNKLRMKLLAATSLCVTITLLPSHGQDSTAEARREAVQDYQAQAVRLYPELGKVGSPINKCFLKAYDDVCKANDPLKDQSNWPLVIARHAAECIEQRNISTAVAKDTGILTWLQKTREESAKQVRAAQAAQEEEAQRQEKLAELERNSAVLRGTVSQIVSDGIIMDARFLDGYDSEGGRNAPMIVRNLDGNINPQQSGFTPRYRTEQLFLSGHPQKDSLIDGAEIAVIAVPAGAYHYTTVVGALKTIRSWMVLKIY